VSTSARISLFAFIYVGLFVGAMASITGGVMDIAAAVSAPVILCAEALVLGMIYATTFHGEAHEEPHEVQAPKLDIYSHGKHQIKAQHKV
jgi:hypothetical protein